MPFIGLLLPLVRREQTEQRSTKVNEDTLMQHEVGASEKGLQDRFIEDIRLHTDCRHLDGSALVRGKTSTYPITSGWATIFQPPHMLSSIR